MIQKNSDVNIKGKIKNYHFEWKHLLVLFIVLIFFQIIISFIQQISLTDLKNETLDWYKMDSAEKIADLTTTSFELLLETSNVFSNQDDLFKKDMIQAFNIIFSQQLLAENINEVYVLVSNNDKIFAINDGTQLYTYFVSDEFPNTEYDDNTSKVIALYRTNKDEIAKAEQIFTQEQAGNTFHVFVPLVPNGEYAGAVYLKISPDFSFINRQVTSSYDQSALIFSALILFGLLAMFYISSYTVRERDEAQKQLFREREKHLREQIEFQKEIHFTKRIYHTHHKAEKIMGFIKEDIRNLNNENIDVLKDRVNKYASFVSRVIYDMKWYDPPIQTIRGTMYNTDINELLLFIVNNLFKRVSEIVSQISFQFDMDDTLPKVNVNEYVIWEIVEPLIQNCIDHSMDNKIIIKISTHYDKESQMGFIYIADNGPGIYSSFLEKTDEGIKKIFLEQISTKTNSKKSG